MTVSEIRVRPRHCDAQAMVHAARYYEFFEDAFLDWLDARGGYPALRAGGSDLVVKASGCEYHRPARLDEVLAVETETARLGRTSVTMRFTIRCAGELVAVGNVTYVCVRDGAAAELPAMITGSSSPPGSSGPGRPAPSRPAAR
ncbi:acyl-CoA thioesterase [Nonomuraea sp. NPDC050536]|uniref:acyl-CoA thioesterase n=1 Tax=Nonomuraea sp. NPDC050536 TaxID=3364366 RepID=UPI0037CAB3AF